MSFRERVRRYLTSGFYISFMSCITLFALFGDDLKYIIANDSSNADDMDILFNSLTIFSMFFFSLEICLLCIADRRKDEPETMKTTYIQRYFLSFNFWLDLVSTISLVIDITWVFATVSNDDDGSSDTMSVTGNFRLLSKAGRGVRIGSRAGRIARITRLIRATKCNSIYQNSKINMMNVNLATDADSILIEESQDNVHPGNGDSTSQFGESFVTNQQLTK